MSGFRQLAIGAAMCALMIASVAPQASFAKPTQVDPAKVQALATSIEAAINALGCTVTLQDQVAAIQGAIANSGDDPPTVEAALNVVQAMNNICPSSHAAIASVDQTIIQALQGTQVAAAGGPGGGSPIGPPSTFISGGGSDYVP